MRAREFILEAAYDGMRDRLSRQYPQRAEYITQMTNWARTVLTKPDRVIWVLRIVEKELAGDPGANLGRVMHMLSHFMGIEYEPIQNYVFGNQSPDQVVAGLRALETRYKERAIKAQGVQLQSGDRVIKKWADGLYWVYTDRAYCSDEARSGNHCGNVMGQRETQQRILSLRNRLNQVELTFILDQGSLGEMKARGNTKPKPEFHGPIIWLLEQPFVQKIEGGGYKPSANFDLTDLSPEQIQDLEQKRPEIADWEAVRERKAMGGDPLMVVTASHKMLGEICQALKTWAQSQLPALVHIYYNRFKTDPGLAHMQPPSDEEIEDSINILVDYFDVDGMIEWAEDRNDWDEETTIGDIQSFVYNMLGNEDPAGHDSFPEFAANDVALDVEGKTWTMSYLNRAAGRGVLRVSGQVLPPQGNN